MIYHEVILGEQLWSLGGSECTIIFVKSNCQGDNLITRILIQWIIVTVVLPFQPVVINIYVTQYRAP